MKLNRSRPLHTSRGGATVWGVLGCKHSSNPSERTTLVSKLELGNQGAGTDGLAECLLLGEGSLPPYAWLR